MDFVSACKFSYSEFQEYDAAIGKIRDCGGYWIFFPKGKADEYGLVPIIVYKDDKQPIFMAFDQYLKLASNIEKAPVIEVPEEFK